MKKSIAETLKNIVYSTRECKLCKKTNIAREDQYMINDPVWKKINPELDGWYCWACMKEKIKKELHRNPQPEDFTQYAHVPFNMYNPEIIKLCPIPKGSPKIPLLRVTINTRKYKSKFYNQIDTINMKTLENLHNTHKEYENYEKAIEDINNLKTEYKKKYPSADIKIIDSTKINNPFSTIP